LSKLLALLLPPSAEAIGSSRGDTTAASGPCCDLRLRTNIAGMPALAEGLLLVLDGRHFTALDVSRGNVAWQDREAEGVVHPRAAAQGFA
jgi:hypothetical protein